MHRSDLHPAVYSHLFAWTKKVHITPSIWDAAPYARLPPEALLLGLDNVVTLFTGVRHDPLVLQLVRFHDRLPMTERTALVVIPQDRQLVRVHCADTSQVDHYRMRIVRQIQLATAVSYEIDSRRLILLTGYNLQAICCEN